MIDVVFFSVAGNQEIAEITELFERWNNSSIVPKTYKDALKYTLDIVREGGHYPAKEYYDMYFQDSGQYYASVVELQHYARIVDDYFERAHIQEEITKTLNSAKTSDELKAELSALLESSMESEVSDDDKPILYSETVETPHGEGLTTGIQPVDQLTNGFQPGTVATIAGFTGHGKTQATISTIFRNAKKGKKCVYLSLEMPKEQVWMMFQARWLYEVHNLQVTSTDLIQKKLTKEMLAKVKSLESEYTEEFASNIIVCDSSVLPKGINKSSSVWVLLFKSWERKLKGLDLVAHDHIGQYDRLFPEEGNNIIKMITDATVVYKNKEGAKIVSLFACQCNRDGLKRATKRNGVYDITAISDLNECGHSDTITTVACEGKRGLTFGQVRKRFKEGRKLTVDCVDYSTGKVVSSIVEDAFVTGRVNPEYTWRKLTYEGSGKSIVLTDTHRVLVEGIKVPLNSLPNSFRADCVGWVLTKESEQVLLGTLLGDSTISETEGTDKGTWFVRMYQGKKQKEYLQWKKNMLGEFMHDIKPHGVKFVSCSNSCKELVKYSWTKTRGLKGITYENLIKIEPLGLLVWYLDDGCKVNYSKGSYGVVLACTNFGESGARIMQKVLLDKFGLESKVVVREERRSKKNCVRIELGAVSARKFLDLVSPLIDIECIQYKLDNSRVSKNPVEPNPPYRGVIKQGLFVTQREVKMSCKKYLSKYNFTVSHPDHNYVLPGGLVSSNCERASAYIVFLYTPEDKAISQETVVTLAKHRLGAILSEPTPVAFIPSVSTVGSTVEQISYNDDISSFGDEFGDFGGSGDFTSGDLDL